MISLGVSSTGNQSTRMVNKAWKPAGQVWNCDRRNNDHIPKSVVTNLLACSDVS
jgi:hypothetical protein